MLNPTPRRARWEHKIKPNEREITPKLFAALDTETAMARDGNTLTHTWRLGVACTWRTDTKTDNAPKWLTAESPLDLWRHVTAAARVDRRLYVFAHNLGFDLTISDAFNILPQLGWRVRSVLCDQDITRADFTDGKRTMVCIDSMTYFPAALQTIAQSLGRSKTPLPQQSDDTSVWEERCRTDVDILREAIDCFVTWWSDHGMGNFSPSGAGCGWAMWRHKHYTHEVIVHADEEALRAEKRATFMGRCEALIKGTDMEGPWFQWDMQSAYPRIAAQVDLPWKLTSHARRVLPSRVKGLHDRLRVLYDVEVETDLPVVPWRDSTGICWPVGTFRTLLWDVEYDLARAAGCQLEPRYVWLYRKAPVLKSWAEWTLDRIAAGDDGAPGPVPLWIKHQSRATIGKFATSYPEWESLGDTGDMVPNAMEEIDVQTMDIGRTFTFGGTVYSATKRKDGQNTFPAINSVVVAEGRVRMWQALQAIPEGHAAYCDTDGLWTTAEGSRAMEKHAEAFPGHGWRLKSTASRLSVWGPQAVLADDEHKISGIPKLASLSSRGTWQGEKWEGFLASMQRSGGGSVQTITTEWSTDRQDTRRNPDGSPVRVEGNLRIEGK